MGSPILHSLTLDGEADTLLIDTCGKIPGDRSKARVCYRGETEVGSSLERTPPPAPSVQQYREAVRQASSGHWTVEAVAQLQTLAARLGIEPIQATAIEREVLGQPKEAILWRLLRDRYRDAVREMAGGGMVNEVAEAHLRALRQELGLNEHQAAGIEREVLGETVAERQERQTWWQERSNHYRQAVMSVRAAGGILDAGRVAYLDRAVQQLQLSEDRAAAIEREILGTTRRPATVASTAAPAALNVKQLVAIAGSALLFLGVFLPAFGPENYWLDGYGSGKFLLLAAAFSLAIALYRPFHRFLWITGGSALAIIVWDIIIQPQVFSQADPRWGLAVVVLGATAILASAFVPVRTSEGRWSFDL